MTVVDGSGIHKVKFRFCECHQSSFSSKRAQLLRAEWYPATLSDPETCAMFRVLEDILMPITPRIATKPLAACSTNGFF